MNWSSYRGGQHVRRLCVGVAQEACQTLAEALVAFPAVESLRVVVNDPLGDWPMIGTKVALSDWRIPPRLRFAFAPH